jgi:hypothetical protein
METQSRSLLPKVKLNAKEAQLMSGARIADVRPHDQGCEITLEVEGHQFKADFSYASGKYLDRTCQEVAGILAANFALSYLPLDEIAFVCSDDEEFQLMSTIAYQSRMSYGYFVRDNKEVSNQILNTEPRYTWKKSETDKVKVAKDPNSVLCFYSGGKDSTVSLKSLEATGYSALPFFIFLRKETYRHTAEDAHRLFQTAGNDFAVANTNIDELKTFLTDVTSLPLLEGTIRLYWVANALPLATGIKAKFMSLSNELTLTDVVQHAGRKIFNNLFDQTFPATVLVNRLLEKNGLPTLFSPVQGLTTHGIQKILSTYFPEEMIHQLSCNQPVWDEITNQWCCCSQCKKCYSLYLNVKSLGLSPDLLRLDEDEVLSSRFAPEELIGPDISRKELEHCLSLDNTYAPNYKGADHPEVGGIQFSAAYHNPTLILNHEEYLNFYSKLNSMLKGGICLNHNHTSKTSNLGEVWDTLRGYDYAFDGREVKVVKRTRVL